MRRLAEKRRHREGGVVFTGHHNMNYVVKLGWRLGLLLGTNPITARGKFRTALDTVEVVPRIWPREADVLAVVSRRLPEVPSCLADFGDWSLHLYREGIPLSEALPRGAVGGELMTAFAEFFARTAAVPERELPPRPDDWPLEGDSQGFLHWLADFTDERVHRRQLSRFGALFDAVGIPENAMARFKETYRTLKPRPFCLLHTDVHRANVILGANHQISVIDWELAIYGDPLHELATHLVRMGYDEDERVRMTARWGEAMRRHGHGEMTAGMESDLPAYLALEQVQSVFPDVMRAALSLDADADADEHDLAAAARNICRAVSMARRRLNLKAEETEEGEPRAVAALRAWLTESAMLQNHA